jgi:hypothetical protein
MKNLKINDDWERESLKDLVYLQEEIATIEQDMHRFLNRQPAKIEVIDRDKILNRKHEHQNDVLPF